MSTHTRLDHAVDHLITVVREDMHHWGTGPAGIPGDQARDLAVHTARARVITVVNDYVLAELAEARRALVSSVMPAPEQLDLIILNAIRETIFQSTEANALYVGQAHRLVERLSNAVSLELQEAINVAIDRLDLEPAKSTGDPT